MGGATELPRCAGCGSAGAHAGYCYLTREARQLELELRETADSICVAMGRMLRRLILTSSYAGVTITELLPELHRLASESRQQRRRRRASGRTAP